MFRPLLATLRVFADSSLLCSRRSWPGFGPRAAVCQPLDARLCSSAGAPPPASGQMVRGSAAGPQAATGKGVHSPGPWVSHLWEGPGLVFPREGPGTV